LARLIDSILFVTESATIVKTQSFICFLIEWHIEHETYDSCACASFTMITMKSYNSSFIAYLFSIITLKIAFGFESYLYKRGERRSLVIRPLVLLHSAMKLWIIVRPAADIDYQEIVLMVLIEVISNIIYWVSIYFLNEIRSRISHGYDPVGNVSEIQLLTIVWCFLFWACHYLFNKRCHYNNISTIFLRFNILQIIYSNIYSITSH